MSRDAARRPCLLCGSRHRAYIHAWCERLVRCADGRNHQLLIVSLICQEAKEQHKQYTKRILPWFVIPECNIRLDLVLNLLKLEERAASGGRALAYAQADAVIGSACERTIARHRQWARRLAADTLLEASELVVELAPFTTLPGVHVGAGGLAELRRYLAALTAARRSAYGDVGAALEVIGSIHLRYVVERARNPVTIPLNQVLRRGGWFDTS